MSTQAEQKSHLGHAGQAARPPGRALGNSMKRRIAIAAVSGAALLSSGAFALPALASPAAASHKLSFIVVQKKAISFTSATAAVENTDYGKSHKIAGFSMLYVKATSPSRGNGHITVDARGGFLYGTFIVNTNTGVVTHGKVTGGTGKFTGATGTFKARNLNNAGTRTAVTITYRR